MNTEIGARFGRLVIEAAGVRPYYWRCRCDCGKAIEAAGSNLRSGATRSCGCIRREKNNHTTHGQTGTLTHKRWLVMRRRCTDQHLASFPRYGGRGIKVCERWDDFENFLADLGECPSAEFTIDRINNNGNYEPGNCRWATRLQQNRNTRANRMLTFRGETFVLSVWAERLGIKSQTIQNRLRAGWSVERALTDKSDARAHRKSRRGNKDEFLGI